MIKKIKYLHTSYKVEKDSVHFVRLVKVGSNYKSINGHIVPVSKYKSNQKTTLIKSIDESEISTLKESLLDRGYDKLFDNEVDSLTIQLWVPNVDPLGLVDLRAWVEESLGELLLEHGIKSSVAGHSGMEEATIILGLSEKWDKAFPLIFEWFYKNKILHCSLIARYLCEIKEGRVDEIIYPENYEGIFNPF